MCSLALNESEISLKRRQIAMSDTLLLFLAPDLKVVLMLCQTSGTDSDQDFDPTAEMLVNDFDDEHTLDEEEAINDETNEEEEIDDLQKACISHTFTCF